jgi:hypothetical protein
MHTTRSSVLVRLRTGSASRLIAVWIALVAVVAGLGFVGAPPANAVAARDFSVVLSPSTVTVNAGGSTTARVRVIRGRKFRGAFTYRVINKLSGVGTTLQLAPGGASISVTAASTAASLTGQIAVQVTAGGRTKQASLDVQVIGVPATPTPPVPPTTKPAPTTGEFSITVDQSTVALLTGATAVVGVFVNASGGYVGSPTFAATGAPVGITTSFLNPSSPFGTNMIVTASPQALRGEYPIVVTGTDGSRVRQATVLVKVSAANPFTLVASFESARTAPGTTVNLKVAVVAAAGSPAPDVDISISGIPSGTSTPAVIRTSTSATFIVTFGTSVADTDVIVAVRGVSGTYAASTQASIRVSARPQVSLSTTDLSVAPTGTALYEILYTASNGIPTPSYVVKGTPAGAQSSIFGDVATGRLYVRVVTTAATPKGVYPMVLETQSGTVVTPIAFTLRVV